MNAFRTIQPKPAPRPSHLAGMIDAQGIAKGRSRIADSPESAGFFDATKKTQKKMDAAANRKSPAAEKPPRESLNARVIAMPPDVRVQRRRAVGAPPVDSNLRISLAIRASGVTTGAERCIAQLSGMTL